MWERIGVVSAAGLACICYVDHLLRMRHPLTHAQRHVMDRRLVRASLSLLFPVVYFAVIPRHDHGNILNAIPLLWNFMAWNVDSHLMSLFPFTRKNSSATLRLDPSLLTGLSFGVCNLAGIRCDDRYMNIALLAILGCMLTVMPVADVARRTRSTLLSTTATGILVVHWSLGGSVLLAMFPRRAHAIPVPRLQSQHHNENHAMPCARAC